MSLKYCPHCNSENLQKARYCQNCGKGITGVRGKLGAMKQRFEYHAKQKMDEIKESVDIRVNDYLRRLDDPTEVGIGNVKIPDDRRDSVRKALRSFQEKLGTHEVETSKEFQQWLDKLPEMLDQQKCLVCYANWDLNDDLVVCRHCQSGGHKVHLESWVATNSACPLCRQTISLRDLIQVEIE